MPSAPVTPAATARGGYDRPPSNAQNATTMPVDPTKHDAMRRPIAALWSTPDDYRVGGHSGTLAQSAILALKSSIWANRSRGRRETTEEIESLSLCSFSDRRRLHSDRSATLDPEGNGGLGNNADP